jgi:hypothetical protein
LPDVPYESSRLISHGLFPDLPGLQPWSLHYERAMGSATKSCQKILDSTFAKDCTIWREVAWPKDGRDDLLPETPALSNRTVLALHVLEESNA